MTSLSSALVSQPCPRLPQLSRPLQGFVPIVKPEPRPPAYTRRVGIFSLVFSMFLCVCVWVCGCVCVFESHHGRSRSAAHPTQHYLDVPWQKPRPL